VAIEETTTRQIRAESFPDLGDEVMYPRLSERKLERLAKAGARRSFAPGETLYEQGQRDTPFFVIERGRGPGSGSQAG
jgi:thioredoxin reductase (NADPH)